MTERLFDKDSYIKEFTATVTDCISCDGKYKILLDKTAFFYEGGGQKADTGTLNGVEVLDVQEEEGNIFHYTYTPFNKGETVEGCLDWHKRFFKMQNHSAEHIISGLVHKKFGYENVGFHLGEDFVTMDFNGSISQSELEEIEREANLLAHQGRRITAWYPEDITALSYRSKLDLVENVRLVEIEGIDLCACCAPHVKNTAQIGMIKLLSWQKYKEGVRILAKSGMYAFNEMHMYQITLRKLSSLLSLPFEETPQGVEKLLNRLQDMNYQLNGLKSRILNHELRESDSPFYFSEDYDLKEAVNILKGRYPLLCGAFLGNDENGYRFMIYTSDIESVKALLKDKLGASAGGRDNMLQGAVKATKKQITDNLNLMEI